LAEKLRHQIYQASRCGPGEILIFLPIKKVLIGEKWTLIDGKGT
jgi:hypothetical protein